MTLVFAEFNFAVLSVDREIQFFSLNEKLKIIENTFLHKKENVKKYIAQPRNEIPTKFANLPL